jgi:hypothetical protein
MPIAEAERRYRTRPCTRDFVTVQGEAAQEMATPSTGSGQAPSAAAKAMARQASEGHPPRPLATPPQEGTGDIFCPLPRRGPRSGGVGNCQMVTNDGCRRSLTSAGIDWVKFWFHRTYRTYETHRTYRF